MSAVDQVFADLRATNSKALMPFFTAGAPDIAVTAEVIRAPQAFGLNSSAALGLVQQILYSDVLFKVGANRYCFGW